MIFSHSQVYGIQIPGTCLITSVDFHVSQGKEDNILPGVLNGPVASPGVDGSLQPEDNSDISCVLLVLLPLGP